MEQNCFQFDQQYYKQTEELVMGAHTSAILAEVYTSTVTLRVVGGDEKGTMSLGV
jgi:hypothetical protein